VVGFTSLLSQRRRYRTQNVQKKTYVNPGADLEAVENRIVRVTAGNHTAILQPSSQ